MKVIPRDLFSDANLLMNYGKLYIQLERYNLHRLLNSNMMEYEQFHIVTDNSSGFTHIGNIRLYNLKGEEIQLFRGLNNRDTYSLWFIGEDDDYPVFTEEGNLTVEFLEAVGYTE